jgi:hypothetical protein
MMEVPEIHTERLLMRGYRDEDHERFAAILGDPVAREHWGKGYAPEAARASCDWAHRELGARHIVSLIHPLQRRSIRVAEKLGRDPGGPPQRPRLRPARVRDRPAAGRFGRVGRGYTACMAMNEEDRERTSMDADLDTPEDDLLRREESAAAREAGAIGGRRPEYEDEEGDPASEQERALIEGGEGVEEGFETAESDLRESASHGENRYDPEAEDFGDEESAGEGDAVSGEADEIDQPE